jgi:hypothetical protein
MANGTLAELLVACDVNQTNDNSEFYIEDQWENNVFDSNVSVGTSHKVVLP